ncbi:amidase family protein [Caenimonas soli]|uniref:amidase family protein n=1 Tax=Caenimonas soli TaxID=2735555 RepID=UPI0015534D37|nr:amidase family protein [Caenimonas soli]NPC57766.1 hypothetical protein [Caenimonas soli]
MPPELCARRPSGAGSNRFFIAGSATNSKASIIPTDRTLALEDAASVFRDRGAVVVDVTLPPLADWSARGEIIALAEGYAVHEKWMKSRPQDYGECFRDYISMGAFLSAADYVEAQRMRRDLCAAFDETMRKVDVLLCATSRSEAPSMETPTKVVNSFELPWFNSAFNVRGTPALAVCTGFTAAGLPLGMQLVGRPFEDATVLRAGHHYEKATPCATGGRRFLRSVSLVAQRRNGIGAPALATRIRLFDGLPC